jgi:isopenicillin-N epimerase
MVAHPLPSQKNPDLKERLWKDHQIEIPIFEWEGQEFIRISIQVYNSKNDVNLLMSALHALL